MSYQDPSATSPCHVRVVYCILTFSLAGQLTHFQDIWHYRYMTKTIMHYLLIKLISRDTYRWVHISQLFLKRRKHCFLQYWRKSMQNWITQLHDRKASISTSGIHYGPIVRVCLMLRATPSVPLISIEVFSLLGTHFKVSIKYSSIT